MPKLADFLVCSRCGGQLVATINPRRKDCPSCGLGYYHEITSNDEDVITVIDTFQGAQPT